MKLSDATRAFMRIVPMSNFELYTWLNLDLFGVCLYYNGMEVWMQDCIVCFDFYFTPMHPHYNESFFTCNYCFKSYDPAQLKVGEKTGLLHHWNGIFGWRMGINYE